MTTEKPTFFFWLIKATPSWLALPPLGAGSRLEFVGKVLPPLLEKYPKVTLRYFDAEAYSTVCSDVMLWTSHDNRQYHGLVEGLRETPFWDHYFQVVHIIPTLEDQYAEHYQQNPLQPKS
jgi:hypothetical protein